MNRISTLLLLTAVAFVASEHDAKANHAPKWKVVVTHPSKPCGFTQTIRSQAELEPESFPSFDYDLKLKTWVEDPVYFMLEDVLWNAKNQQPQDRCADFQAWHEIGIGAIADIACLPGSFLRSSEMCEAFAADPNRVRTAMVLYHDEAARQCPDKEQNVEFGRHNIGLLLKEKEIFKILTITAHLDDVLVSHLPDDEGVLVGRPKDAWEWYLRKEIVAACGLTPPIECRDVWPVEGIANLYAEAEELADGAFRSLIGFLVQEPICEPNDPGATVSGPIGTYGVWSFGTVSEPCTEVLPPIGDPLCEEMTICDKCAAEQGLCIRDGQFDPTSPYCACVPEWGPHYVSPNILQANAYRMLKNLIENDHDEYLCQISEIGVLTGQLEQPICSFDDAIDAFATLAKTTF